MRVLPFGVGLASILAGAIRAAVTPSNVLWHIPKLEGTHYNGRRYKTGRAYGYNHGKLYATNGKRECERRMRQIERGQLRVENGLDPITV